MKIFEPIENTYLGYDDFKGGISVLGLPHDTDYPLAETLRPSFQHLTYAQADADYVIPDLLESRVAPNLPSSVLFHVYDAQLDEGFWYPDLFGQLSLEALALYEKAFHDAYPWSNLNIYVAGDHRDERAGNKISWIYEKLIGDRLSQRKFCIIDSESTVNWKGAHDSTGELDYLVGRVGNEHAISLSVAAHRPYIDRLCNGLGYRNITPISAEGLLLYFKPELLERFLHDDICRIGNRNGYPSLNMTSYLEASARLLKSRRRLIGVLNASGPFAGTVARGIQNFSGAVPPIKRRLLDR